MKTIIMMTLSVICFSVFAKDYQVKKLKNNKCVVYDENNKRIGTGKQVTLHDEMGNVHLGCLVSHFWGEKTYWDNFEILPGDSEIESSRDYEDLDPELYH